MGRRKAPDGDEIEFDNPVSDGFDVERGKSKKLSKQGSAGLSSDTIQTIARQKGVFEGEKSKQVSTGATNSSSKAISARDGGFKCTDLMHEHSTWEKAVQKNDGACTGSCAGLVAFLRLVGWHLLVPISYLIFLALLYDEIDVYQLVFAIIVAVRMLISILFTLACTKINPAFLLVDVSASMKQTDAIPHWDGGDTFLWLYLFAPEKYVMFALFDSGGLDHHESLISLAFGSMALDGE
jgi:hypothetical protein